MINCSLSKLLVAIVFITVRERKAGQDVLNYLEDQNMNPDNRQSTVCQSGQEYWTAFDRLLIFIKARVESHLLS